MTPEKREELRRLAETATNGPWYVGEKERWQLYEGRFVRSSFDKSGTALVVSTGANADFIAAANPAAVLDLLAEHDEDQGVIRVWRGRTERAEAERDTLKAENERLRAALDVLERCAQKALDGVVDCLNECDLNLANEACANSRELTRE